VLARLLDTGKFTDASTAGHLHHPSKGASGWRLTGQSRASGAMKDPAAEWQLTAMILAEKKITFEKPLRILFKY